MSEEPVGGDRAPDDDDASEGKVVPFPGPTPVPAKPLAASLVNGGLSSRST